MTPPDPRPITVRVADDQPACPHCGTSALLAAQVPHGWDNPDGTATKGTITTLLCERCDADKPAAAALITYFHVHGQIDAGTVGEAAALIQEWVEGTTIPSADLAQLDAEVHAWRRGEL